MATAILKNYRQSPQKVRLVADLVRGVPVEKAIHRLSFSTKRASRAVENLIRSAMANAEDRGEDLGSLVVSSIEVNEGPTLRRSRARAQGRTYLIRKRTSHIAVILAPKNVKESVTQK